MPFFLVIVIVIVNYPTLLTITLTLTLTLLFRDFSLDQALNPARPGPLALKPSRPGLKSGPASKMWKAGDGWSKATGVGYYVIMSACAVVLSTHRAIQLPH